MEETRKEDWQAWVALACRGHGLPVPADAQLAIARALMRLSAVAADIAASEADDD